MLTSSIAGWPFTEPATTMPVGPRNGATSPAPKTHSSWAARGATSTEEAQADSNADRKSRVVEVGRGMSERS